MMLPSPCSPLRTMESCSVVRDLQENPLFSTLALNRPDTPKKERREWTTREPTLAFSGRLRRCYKAPSKFSPLFPSDDPASKQPVEVSATILNKMAVGACWGEFYYKIRPKYLCAEHSRWQSLTTRHMTKNHFGIKLMFQI